MDDMYTVGRLNALSMEEQKQLKANLDQAIAETESLIREDALSKIEELARTANLSPKDLASCLGISRTGAPRSNRTRDVAGIQPPKYRDPDTEQTWSGFGKRPTWLKEQLASGRSLEDFKIATLSVATPITVADD